MSSVPFTWTFQGGKRKTVEIAATAGNVVTNLSPGAGKRWLVLHGSLILTNDATAADRIAIMEVTDGTDITEEICYSGNITASQVGHLNFGEARIVASLTLSSLAGNVKMYVGTAPILLEGVDQLRIRFYNGVAGDSYEGFIVVLEIDI